MKVRDVTIVLVICATILLASYLVSEGHRYDVVAAGAGSGGSQESTGSTEVVGYLVDHKTGKVLVIGGNLQPIAVPTFQFRDPCGQNFEVTPLGCVQKAK
jgi:hypothetical protein